MRCSIGHAELNHGLLQEWRIWQHGAELGEVLANMEHQLVLADFHRFRCQQRLGIAAVGIGMDGLDQPICAALKHAEIDLHAFRRFAAGGIEHWVVSLGDPAANANLLPNAASADTAGPAPSRLLRLSSVTTWLPMVSFALLAMAIRLSAAKFTPCRAV